MQTIHSGSGLQPAVFLDRDGVLNHERSYITRPEDFQLYDFARAAVINIKERGYLCIVVSNQSAIGRGMMAEETLRKIHRIMLRQLPLDDVLFCPHAPETDGCECRKPKPGLLWQAAEKHGLELARSFMVGDRSTDLVAGIAAGVTPVLVLTGYGGMTKADIPTGQLVFANLLDFSCSALLTAGRK